MKKKRKKKVYKGKKNITSLRKSKKNSKKKIKKKYRKSIKKKK